MENKGKWFTIPVIGALFLAIAVGVMAFSPSSAADNDLTTLMDEDDTEEPLPWKRGFGGMRGIDRGGRVGFGTSFDYDAFMAETLGVTVTELQDARQAAQRAGLDQAVAEGVITEEKADLMKARQALRLYIDPKEIITEALGIDLSDLEAARQEGKPLPFLFGELGLEPAEIKEALQSAYEDAVQQAVDDGVITESQAEQLHEDGIGGRGFGMRGSDFHGRGDFPFQKPMPNADNDL